MARELRLYRATELPRATAFVCITDKWSGVARGGIDERYPLPAALLPPAKPGGADNVTGGAKLESEGKAQKDGGKTQNYLERRRRTEGHHK